MPKLVALLGPVDQSELRRCGLTQRPLSCQDNLGFTEWDFPTLVPDQQEGGMALSARGQLSHKGTTVEKAMPASL